MVRALYEKLADYTDRSTVVFFKTRAPVEPAALVQRICEDASKHSLSKRTRATLRLAPVTLMAHGSEDGLQTLIDKVLAPYFNQDSSPAYTYAIRTNLRAHHVLTRDLIIQQVAAAMNRKHRVDLKNYDRLILVEAYKVRSLKWQ